MDKHIQKILYKSGYCINEDVKYNRIDSSYFKNDDYPDFIQEDETNNDPVDNSTNDVVNDTTNDTVNDTVSDTSIDVNDQNNNEKKDVNIVQNEIIKSTINTMNMIHDKLKSLDSIVNNLSMQYDDIKNNYESLKKDVDIVKEPSNSEKLEMKKIDSAPYNVGIDDFIMSNKFNNKYTDNIVKLKDGTYLGVFDNLGNFSNDIEKSFYQYE